MSQRIEGANPDFDFVKLSESDILTFQHFENVIPRTHTMICRPKVGLTHPDLLGEKRLENGEEHVEEPARLADVNLPKPEGKPILKSFK